MNSNQNAAQIIMEDIDYEDEDDIDKLGTLELEELDGIVTFADNMATKLAIQTKQRLENLGKKHKDNILEQSQNIRNKYDIRRQKII